MDLKGKRIVVTGASSGIGLRFTQRMIKAGARVIGVSRNKKDLEKLFGDTILPVECDVSKKEDIDRLFDIAEEYFGDIDIFVANAGFAYYGKIGAPDWDKNKKIFDTNVMSPIYTLQKLTYEKKNPVTFVLTISALGKMVLPGFTLYDSTKFALDGFIRTYRMEKPKHVRVMPVYPVATFKNFWKRADDAVMPFPPNTAGYVAWHMEKGLKFGARSVYPSLAFLIRCLIQRVLPVDLAVQGIERIRYKAWLKRHGQYEKQD